MSEPGITVSLEQSYKTVLADYLREGGESHLNAAYEIGREALRSGVGLVGLVNVHYAALVSSLREQPVAGTMAEIASSAGRVLLETAAPFSVLHVDSAESNAALRRLNALFEEAANRIAHSLHDDATQMLGVVYLELALLRSEAPESMRARVDRITRYLDQTCEQLRHLSHELRPPMLERLGLVPALRYLIAGFQHRHNLTVTLNAPDLEERLPLDVELMLYRVVQEGLRNAVRHAYANGVEVTLRVSASRITCAIRDDGKGFDTSAPAVEAEGKGGLGLMGIRERASVLGGTVNIQSSPGQGTELRISIPIGE